MISSLVRDQSGCTQGGIPTHFIERAIYAAYHSVPIHSPVRHFRLKDARQGWGTDPARSEALRRTQNSLPSGSARIVQPVPSGSRRSATRVAPRCSRRSTSSSRVESGRRHRCTRFFTAFGSGTLLKCRIGPSRNITRVSSSPGPSSGWTGQPVTSLQKRASSYGSAQSIATFCSTETMDGILPQSGAPVPWEPSRVADREVAVVKIT
ncbi:hypothetical protein DMB42_21475 [Nonomuraea sp. WAC 01424]|nr:hypothetical protein DMB42_21475 [Nonomuraea sp. WAC 01424]